jgi:hypothetical protein
MDQGCAARRRVSRFILVVVPFDMIHEKLVTVVERL